MKDTDPMQTSWDGAAKGATRAGSSGGGGGGGSWAVAAYLAVVLAAPFLLWRRSGGGAADKKAEAVAEGPVEGDQGRRHGGRC